MALIITFPDRVISHHTACGLAQNAVPRQDGTPRDTPRLLAAFCWSLRSASHLPTSSLSLSLPFNHVRCLHLFYSVLSLSLSFQLCLCCVLYRTFVIPIHHSFTVLDFVCYVAAAAPGQALSSHGPYVGGLFFSDLLPSLWTFSRSFFSFIFLVTVVVAPLQISLASLLHNIRISLTLRILAGCSTCGVSVVPSRRHGILSIQLP